MEVMEERKIAVLIDADNIPKSAIPLALNELSKYGQVILKRAFGDWSTDNLKGWKEILFENAIEPIQQFAFTKGKNSSDISLVINAMDLLYTHKYDSFAIISSDSDFTSLIFKLKFEGMYTIGIGESKAPVAFQKVCDKYISTDYLLPNEELNDENENLELDAYNNLKRSDLFVEISNIYKEMEKDEEGFVEVLKAFNILKKKFPTFRPSDFGYSSHKSLLNSFENISVKRYKKDPEDYSKITYFKILGD